MLTLSAVGSGLLVVAFLLYARWRFFEKAGREGWEALIPIYNAYILLKIVDRPGWWLLLLLVPIVNIFVVFRVAIDVARSFGKDTAFGVGLVLLSFIFVPILAFSEAQYGEIETGDSIIEDIGSDPS